LFCLPVIEGPSDYYVQDAEYESGKPYVAVVGQQPFNEVAQRFVRCLNADDGSLAWERQQTAGDGRTPVLTMSGLLVTAGGLLFSADANVFTALDALNGDELWRLNTGALVLAPPVTYQADEQQYVVVATGRMLLAFGLPDQT